MHGAISAGQGRTKRPPVAMVFPSVPLKCAPYEIAQGFPRCFVRCIIIHAQEAVRTIICSGRLDDEYWKKREAPGHRFEEGGPLRGELNHVYHGADQGGVVNEGFNEAVLRVDGEHIHSDQCASDNLRFQSLGVEDTSIHAASIHN